MFDSLGQGPQPHVRANGAPSLGEQVSTGGYVAVPVGLAAKFCRRALVIHEQTVRLGLANRALARAAARAGVSSESTLSLLPDAVRASAVVTGNPVRPEVLTGRPDKAISALSLTGFDPALPTVYVTGGARGSVQINTVVRAVLPWLLTQAIVIHQCGATSIEESSRYATGPTRTPSGAAAWSRTSSARSSPTFEPSPTS